MIERNDLGDGIAELRLARPPVNAINLELARELTTAVRDAPGAGHTALVVSGGEGIYSAGLDVPWLLTLERDALTEFWGAFGDMLNALALSQLPVAAAITGHAPAGGTVLAAFCEYRVMADGGFSMGFTEAQVGLPVPPGIHAAFERWCGPRIAAQYSVEGRIFDGRHGLEIGLVDELVPPAHTVERAADWCRRILALPSSTAVTMTRETVRAPFVAAITRGLIDAEAMTDIWMHEDTQRAMQAMVERIKKK